MDSSESNLSPSAINSTGSTQDSTEDRVKPLWSGTPRARLFYWEDSLKVVFGIWWGIFFTPWAIFVSGTPTVLSILLFCFLWAFLYYVSLGRIVARYRRLQQTRYEVTQTEIIVYRSRRDFFTDARTARSLSNVPNIMLVFHRDGTGSILFLDYSYDYLQRPTRINAFRKRLTNMFGMGISAAEWTGYIGFEHIANPQEVYDLVKHLQVTPPQA